jgi:HEPN domain-containing protein
LTRKEEEKRLLKRSGDFFETAKYQTSQSFFDLATFSLEQSLELFLKAKVSCGGR